jgi:branched-chain amino acid aminotransferase
VFIVQGGTLFTAPVAGTLLPGITRLAVMTLAQDAGIPVREQVLPREMLYTADEIFVCGTASEVTPVRSMDKIPIGTGKPGPVTHQIQRTYLQTVRGEIEDKHGWLTYVSAERASASRASRA